MHISIYVYIHIQCTTQHLYISRNTHTSHTDRFPSSDVILDLHGHQQLEALSCDISLPGAPFAKAAPQLQQKLQQIKAPMRQGGQKGI